MDFFKPEFLDILLPQRDGMHISIYMEFDRETDKWEANRIRFKNLRKEAKALWGEQDNLFPEQDLQRLFPEQADLIASDPAIGRPGQGLVIFWNKDFSTTYYLPYNPGEQVVLGHRFTLRPLLPLLEDNGDFYLLTLSQERVNLWRGDRYQMTKLEVPGMPAGLAETLALEDPERQLQFHTSSGSAVGGGDDRRAMFFGHDANKEKKGAVRRYLNEVAEVVDKYLREQKIPLLTAGVDYIRPIYAEVSTYPHLLKKGVIGNPEHKSGEDLQQQAWEVVWPVLNQKKEEILSQLVARQHTDQVAESLEDIVPAATYGRVQALFVPANGSARELTAWRLYGNHDFESPLTDLNIATEEDYIDEAIVQTLRNSGQVFLVDRPGTGDIPEGAEFPAALLRY